MSTSYDDTAEGVIPVVEAFRYHDTFGRSTSDLPVMYPGEVVEANAAGVNKTPRNGQEDVSRLIAEARAEGLTEGERRAATRFEEQLAQERKQISDMLLQFHQQRTEYYSRVEIELVHLSLAIASKILHRESQIDRMVLAGLVKVMLEKLQQKTRVIVRVRPEDAKGWTYYFRDVTNLEVVGDPTLEPKACLLETELGVADLALDAQLKEVEQGFFDLLAQRPEPK
jgi:flagellar assembly protein FliH